MARKAHPKIEYDYSLLLDNVKIMDHVNIGCPECGQVFNQGLNDHIYAKAGCPKCGHSRGGKSRSLTREEFIRRAIAIHGIKYDYNSVPEIIRAHFKVSILCKKHSRIFDQVASSHLRGIGCPRCGRKLSRAEDDLYDIIIDKRLNVIRRYRGWTSRRFEIDLFLPDLKIGIEYNGLAYHHSALGCTGYKDPLYHKEKSDLALSTGIKLYHLFEGYSNQKDLLDILSGTFETSLQDYQRGAAPRDKFPFIEDTPFYKEGWVFSKWEPRIFYWKPGSKNGRGTFYISETPDKNYRPVYTSGQWVFERPVSNPIE
jgi:predicted  nucleic acid-binding Zn-ribbon protein